MNAMRLLMLSVLFRVVPLSNVIPLASMLRVIPQGITGQVEMTDESLSRAGIHAGDIALVDVGVRPKDGGLCAAFAAGSGLVVRYFYRQDDGLIRLEARHEDVASVLYTSSAVIIIGRVRRVEDELDRARIGRDKPVKKLRTS